MTMTGAGVLKTGHDLRSMLGWKGASTSETEKNYIYCVNNNEQDSNPVARETKIIKIINKCSFCFS